MSDLETPARTPIDPSAASAATSTGAPHASSAGSDPPVDVRGIASKARRGGSWAIASQGLRFSMQFVAAIIMGRLLTPDDYGLTAMVFVVSSFLSMFRYLGLSQATVQRSSVSQAALSTLFWINIAASTLLASLFVAAIPLLVGFYNEPRLGPITWVVAAAFLTTGAGIQHAALLQRSMRFGTLAAIDVTAVAVSITSGIALAWLGYRYWALVLAQLLLQTTTTVGSILAARWRPGLPRWTAEVRSMVTFGGNVMGFTLVNFFVRNLDNVLIGRVWGPTPLGYYAKAYQMLLMPLQQVNAPLSPVALATLSRLRPDAMAYRRAYLRMIGLIASLSMPLVAAIAGCADWAVVLLLGPQWEPAAHLYAILSLAAIIQPVGSTFGWLLLSQGRAATNFRLALLLAPVTLAGFVIGLPFGPTGVAWSYAITEFVIRMPIQMTIIGREGPVRTRDMWGVLVPWLVTSLGIFLLVSLIRRTIGLHWTPLTGVVVCGLLTAIIALAVPRFSRAGRETHEAWLQLLRPFLTRLGFRRAAA